MKIRTRNHSGLAMIGLLLFIGAVLVIAGTLIYLLIKLCRRVLPPPNPGQTTNQMAYIEEEIADLPPLVIQLPQSFVAPMSQGTVMAELQRTTNLIDWEPILVTNGSYPLSFDADTNPPPDRAFYRLRYFRK